MSLVKTEPGREALHKRDRTLSPRERQILVIADGSRSHHQMVALLGPAAGVHIDRLVQMGFLKSLEKIPGVVPTPAGPSSTSNISNPAEARRSLVATKVYCIDMLQLLRAPEAAVLVRSLQASVSEADLMDQVFLCLRYMQENAAPSYAAKIAARLAEIVPGPYLQSLAECSADGEPALH